MISIRNGDKNSFRNETIILLIELLLPGLYDYHGEVIDERTFTIINR